MNPQNTDTYTPGAVRGYGKGGYPVVFELVLAVVDGTRFGSQIKVFESLFAPQLAKRRTTGSVSDDILHKNF